MQMPFVQPRRRWLLLVCSAAALVLMVAPALASAHRSPPSRGDTMKVHVVAYAGHQPTYTGAKTRHGICATDPAVIPLGTRFFVPGYGECLAADIGGGVRGKMVDVWVLKERTAIRWGVKHLTIRFR